MKKNQGIQQYLDAFYSLSGEQAETLQSVWERQAEGCREGVLLVFTSKRILFSANADDDTIQVLSESADQPIPDGFSDITSSPFWSPWIGRGAGWGWICINQQGYQDGAMFSFEDLTPVIFFHVAASSIKLGLVELEKPLPLPKSVKSAQEGLQKDLQNIGKHV